MPSKRPFTRSEALELGFTDRLLATLVATQQLCHPIQGVYHSADLPNSMGTRVACVALLAPEDAVVTDRSAAWLLGAPMALAPNDHLIVPKISMFRQPGYRLRHGLVA